MSRPFKLVLMRHAKAERATPFMEDFGRPLTERGRQDAARMGTWLADNGPRPDRVISSPAQRARETAELACAALETGKQEIRWERDIYEASAADLARCIERHAQGSNAMLLVGHNPGLDELLLRLSEGPVPRNPAGRIMTTASLAVLVFAGDVSTGPGAGRLEALVRPKELP